MARIFACGRAFDRDQAGEHEASGDRPRRLAVAKRDDLRTACATLDAAARSVNKRSRDAVDTRGLSRLCEASSWQRSMPSFWP